MESLDDDVIGTGRSEVKFLYEAAAVNDVKHEQTVPVLGTNDV